MGRVTTSKSSSSGRSWNWLDARLAELAVEYRLPAEATTKLRTLLAALGHPEAPTTVRDPSHGVDVHIADSLSGLPVIDAENPKAIADLGAGAGLPSLVIAAARPAIQVTAVEGVKRKAAFIRSTAEAMQLTNVDVVALRAEEWREGLGRCDVVCARALAAMPVLLEYAAPLLREGGAMVAWKGTIDETEAADATVAAAELGLAAESVLPVRPFAGSERRTLHVYRKVMETPTRYPRRPGIATKRPLSATK